MSAFCKPSHPQSTTCCFNIVSEAIRILCPKSLSQSLSHSPKDATYTNKKMKLAVVTCFWPTDSVFYKIKPRAYRFTCQAIHLAKLHLQSHCISPFTTGDHQFSR